MAASAPATGAPAEAAATTPFDATERLLRETSGAPEIARLDPEILTAVFPKSILRESALRLHSTGAADRQAFLQLDAIHIIR